MKNQKLLAFATAIATLLSAAAALPAGMTASAAENLISNSTFDSGSKDWGMYKESGGSAVLGSENGKLALRVSSTGTKTYSVQMFYDIIPLYKNGVYRISYDISCTTERYVEGMIQQNGGEYTAYTWEGIHLSPTPEHVEYDFTMKYDSDVMAKLVFNCGNEEADAGKNLGDHTIYLDNVKLELVDGSKVNYSDTAPYESPIVTNQIGYKTNSKKIAVVRSNNNPGGFSVINAQNNSVVYTGQLSAPISNSSANETDYLADFTAVTVPGTYYIQCNGLDDSYKFTVSDDVYDSLFNDTIRMLYLQRCGTQITDNDFGHAACHTGRAKVYGTNDYIDVSGGWHDAGDYGRYVVPAAKTIADLLNAYSMNPTMFSDRIGIPESGNGVADVLDEVRYDLDWLFKMQDPNNGGVHHKVTCENFPGYVMPTEEKAELIVTPISTTATADFCGAMAMGYEYFKGIDAAYANKCLQAAEKAWSYLEQNPNFIFQNPTDITTGDYGDKSDRDERYWAAAQLYRATRSDKYLNALNSMSTSKGMDWGTVGDYGNIAILTMENPDSSLYEKAKSAITSQAATFLKNVNASPYGSPITKYDWGSNMTIANAGVLLQLTAQVSQDNQYYYAAKEVLNYLLGKNPVSTCFVSGYGTVSPQNPHHRPSMAKKKAMPGMLAGGVNSALEDSAAKAYLRYTAPAKCYVDHSESYSTNEITTYWNSPLIYLMAALESNGPTTPGNDDPFPGTTPVDPVIPDAALIGDVNLDGSVTIADAVLLQKYLVRQATLNEKQLANANVAKDSKVNVFDLAALKKLIHKGSGNTTPSQPSNPQPGTRDVSQPDSSATMTADFRKGTSQYFFASDGWTNGSMFNCGWYANNAKVQNGALNLTIDKDYSGKYQYSGGEYRTNDFYGFGYYETRMKAIKNDGVVSSFFTYTGPSDNNPWDEIDIEILGKDTTKAQFNYFTNGQGNHEYMCDLGFDASQGYHTFGFDWQPSYIAWYVDGKEVYRATSNIPQTPGKIMMNVWPGITVDDWLKPFNGNTPLTASYEWVTYKKS